MSALSRLQLRLFFTRGAALADWQRVGNLSRELALYQALLPHLGGVTLVTHGDRRDRELAPGLGVIHNPGQWSELNYTRLLRALSLTWPRGRTILKSNQVYGGDIPLALARRRGFPFIARCGYLLSHAAREDFGAGSPQAARADAEEYRLFHGADRVVVTTPLMAGVVQERHGVAGEKIRVIPNFVDLDLFRPGPPRPPHDPPRLLSVGRLAVQKNILEMVKATAGRRLELWLAGEGPLREETERCIAELGLPVKLLGAVPHASLPGLMHQCDAFLLPTRYEGHPKALLEAMASGLPVIAGEVVGIREEVRHGVNGLLCALDAGAIGAAIDHVLANPELAARLGAAGRQWVAERYGLEQVVNLELDLLAELGEGR